MNPLDVFISKITNYARLDGKQGHNGKLQAELSVKIIKKFTEEIVLQGKIKEAISITQTVFKVGKSTIGKNAINLGVNPFEGIYFDIPDDNFQNEWIPRIKLQIESIIDDDTLPSLR